MEITIGKRTNFALRARQRLKEQLHPRSLVLSSVMSLLVARGLNV